MHATCTPHARHMHANLSHTLIFGVWHIWTRTLDTQYGHALLTRNMDTHCLQPPCTRTMDVCHTMHTHYLQAPCTRSMALSCPYVPHSEYQLAYVPHSEYQHTHYGHALTHALRTCPLTRTTHMPSHYVTHMDMDYYSVAHLDIHYPTRSHPHYTHARTHAQRVIFRQEGAQKLNESLMAKLQKEKAQVEKSRDEAQRASADLYASLQNERLQLEMERLQVQMVRCMSVGVGVCVCVCGCGCVGVCACVCTPSCKTSTCN